MNICRDCAHFRQGAGKYEADACANPLTLAEPDPVHGYRQMPKARDARTNSAMCGMEGRNFEPRPRPVRFAWLRNWA